MTRLRDVKSRSFRHPCTGQFTLYGDCRKGRRPSFSQSAAPNAAKPLYDNFVIKLKNSGLTVLTGEFGAMMQVNLVNDGPVTLTLSKDSNQEPVAN